MRSTLERIFGSQWFGPGAPFGSRIPDIEHPIFGRLVFNQGADGPYWMHEAYDNNEICVAIDTLDTKTPSKEQEKFYLEITGNIDQYFELCRPIILREYKTWFDKPLPEPWSNAFKLASFDIPLNGEGNRDWEISFECITDNSGYLFTCQMVNGKPSSITVDT